MDHNVAINPINCRIRTPYEFAIAGTFVTTTTVLMAQIQAYLTFNGNCREAMNFYKECFGGVLTLQTVKGSPMEEQMPAASQDKILHASLMNGTMVLLGSDLVGGEEVVKGNALLLSVSCSSEAEIQAFFDSLSAGGHVVHPLHLFFAGIMGTLTDKFERDWLLYHEKRVDVQKC